MPPRSSAFEERRRTLRNKERRRLGMPLLPAPPRAAAPGRAATRSVGPVAARPTGDGVPGGNTPPAAIDVILGHDSATGEVVGLGPQDRHLSAAVVGESGSGKSSLILGMMLQDAAAGRGFLAIDPHGQLVDDFLARLPDEQLDTVLLLDLDEQELVCGVNPFECAGAGNPDEVNAVADRWVELVKLMVTTDPRTAGSWGYRLQDLLANIGVTMAETGTTLAEVERLLDPDERPYRARLAARVTNPTVRRFWQADFEQRRDPVEYVSSTINKVRRFTRAPALRAMVGSARTTIRAKDVMDAGRGLLVRINAETFGTEAATLLGGLLGAQVRAEAMARMRLPEHRRRPFTVYADEFHLYATTDFEVMYTGTRKAHVAAVVVSQGRYQLADRLKAATAEVPHQIVFRVGYNSAKELAPIVAAPDGDAGRALVAKPYDALAAPNSAAPSEGVRQAFVEVQRRLTLARDKAERRAADLVERQQRHYRDLQRLYMGAGVGSEFRPPMSASTAMERVRNFLNGYLYHLMANTPEPPVPTPRGPRGYYSLRLEGALTAATGLWDHDNPAHVDDLVRDFVDAAADLGHELNAAPLVAPTWQQRRPTRDLHDEVTAAIMALPDRTARCNLKVHGRAQVRTIATRDLGPPPVGPEELEAHLTARRRAIFARMRQEGLLRPRAEVEAEIAERQAEHEGERETRPPARDDAFDPHKAPDRTPRGPRPTQGAPASPEAPRPRRPRGAQPL
jgi:hypothetical protein